MITTSEDISLAKSSDKADIVKIMSVLKHRYPMLLIDRILSCDGNHVRALKNVTANEQYFVGHFPDYPVMPGVMIVEAMAQAAGAGILIASNITDTSSYDCYFAAIESAKFRHKVIPGDTIIIKALLLKERSKLKKFHCESYVDDLKVAEATISLYTDSNT